MVLALVLLIGLPAVLLLVWNHDNSRRIERRLAKIREAGQPTTYAELDEFYQLPPGTRDTTQLWLDGMQFLVDHKLPDSAQKLPLVGSAKAIPPSAEWPELAEAEELLKQYAVPLEKFHTAARLGGAARYPVDFTKGFETRLDHAQNLRGAARLLTLEAYVRGHRGDAAGCAESIRAVCAARRSLDREPLLVCNLICVALHGMTVQAIADTLATVKYSDDDLRSFQSELRSFDPRSGLRRGFIGERVMGCESYQSGAFMMSDGVKNRHVPILSFDFAKYLELFDDLIAATDRNFPECLAAGPAIETKLKSEAANPVKKFRSIATLLLMPATKASLDASGRGAGASASADAAIAVELYRRKHNRMPASLTQLVPDFLPSVPNDPFDGKPLRYIEQRDGFMIYSIGRDRKDDGGDRNENKDDVIYVPFAK
jgi:hypothetical protein